MKSAPLLLLGIVLAFGAAGAALVGVAGGPLRAGPAAEESGPVAQGRRLYGQLGCAACHTQQLSPRDAAAETGRGWGARRSTAADYPGPDPAPLGALRLGPDLARFAARAPGAAELRRRLRAPEGYAPGTPMPGYAFLSEAEAAALAAYLLTLDPGGSGKGAGP